MGAGCKKHTGAIKAVSYTHLLEIVKEEAFNALHGYMSNAGFEDVRQTIAQSINERFGTSFSEKNLIMTVGAASGLNVILKSSLNPVSYTHLLQRSWRTPAFISGPEREEPRSCALQIR